MRCGRQALMTCGPAGAVGGTQRKACDCCGVKASTLGPGSGGPASIDDRHDDGPANRKLMRLYRRGRPERQARRRTMPAGWPGVETGATSGGDRAIAHADCAPLSAVFRT